MTMFEKIDTTNFHRRACQLTLSQLKQGLVALTCFHVIRALWQVWGSIDNHWPASIRGLTQPMTYISCCLVILLMFISAITTYNVYKVQIRSLTIGWWCYYILTVFCAFSNFIFLSLLYMNKKNFIIGCYVDQEEAFSDSIGMEYSMMCSHIWHETVIWAILDTMVNLMIMFTYVLYRCRVDQSQMTCINHDPLPSFHQLHPTHSTTTTLADLENEGEFHVIDLNK